MRTALDCQVSGTALGEQDGATAVVRKSGGRLREWSRLSALIGCSRRNEPCRRLQERPKAVRDLLQGRQRGELDRQLSELL